MRQLEGAVLSNAAMHAVGGAAAAPAVHREGGNRDDAVSQGTADLVDIDVTVEEGPSSTIGGGIGYSERQSFMLQGNFIDSNLFGSGDRLARRAQRRQVRPGVQRRAHRSVFHGRRGLALAERFVRRARAAHVVVLAVHHPDLQRRLRPRLSTVRGAVPQFRPDYSHENLATAFSSSTQLRDWVRNNGDYYFRRVGRDPVLGTMLDTVEITGGWLYDSRNRYAVSDARRLASAERSHRAAGQSTCPTPPRTSARSSSSVSRAPMCSTAFRSR